MKPGRYYSYEAALAAATGLANALRAETGILRCDEVLGDGAPNPKAWFGPLRVVVERYGGISSREAYDVKTLPVRPTM